MIRFSYFIFAAWAGLMCSDVLQASTQDSLASAPGLFRARLHSASFLPYSGKVLKLRPSSDLMITYDVGFIICYAFESTDIASRRYDINYFQTGFFKKFEVTKNLTATTVAILEIPQNGKLYDDPFWVGGMVFTYSFSKHWATDNTTLLVDGFKQSDSKDVINRLQVKYTSSSRWEASVLFWSNTSYFDHSAFNSAAMMLSFPILSEGKSPDLRASIVYQHMLNRDHGITALKQGLNVSLSAPITFW